MPAGALQGCDKENYDENIKFNLEVYESMKIDQEMCSSNCPCIPNENSSDWTDISTVSIGRCRDWNFAGQIKTYKQCIEEAAAAADTVPVATPFMEFAKGLEGNKEWGIITDFVTWFEDHYTCAGICTPAIFYYSIDVSEGKPGGACLSELKLHINEEFAGLGAATLISGILLGLTWICQYCLWYKYK